jgi:hypothetical protein
LMHMDGNGFEYKVLQGDHPPQARCGAT